MVWPEPEPAADIQIVPHWPLGGHKERAGQEFDAGTLLDVEAQRCLADRCVVVAHRLVIRDEIAVASTTPHENHKLVGRY